MTQTIELPRALWDKASIIALAEMERVEAERPSGPAFWTTEQAARLREIVVDVWTDLPIVRVTMGDDLAKIFMACFDVAGEDHTDITEDDWKAVQSAFGRV